MKDLRIVFMGTPDFAVSSLDILVRNNFQIVGVITAPDKPAGRGKRLNESAVKKYAEEQGLNILQPTNLKDPDFIKDLRALNADVQIVVAFRMLPEMVWSMPNLGTFNLHASLLPQYRGAAPINWAIMNGETETGVTTFLLDQKIDTGRILLQEKLPIIANETAGSLHDRLQELGAELVLKTVQLMQDDKIDPQEQSNFIKEALKEAPKLFKADCRIDWNKDAVSILNHIHGLSPYPAAFTSLISPEGKEFPIKIFKVRFDSSTVADLQTIATDQKKTFSVNLEGGVLNILELQLAGKRKMSTEDFLKGFRLNSDWKLA